METCPISSEDLAELIKALEHMEEVDQLEEDCPTPQRIPRIYAARIPPASVALRHQAVIESLMTIHRTEHGPSLLRHLCRNLWSVSLGQVLNLRSVDAFKFERSWGGLEGNDSSPVMC
jgi:hypothetical protein